YDVGPFNSPVPPRLFDITEPLAPVELLGANFSGGAMSFEDTQAGARRYMALPESLIMRTVMPATDILGAPFTSQENLRDQAEAAEYLVVYYDGFRTAADSLVEWRRSHLPLAERAGPYTTKSVPISALYDQFSGGRTDPAAIRNFLRAAYFNWSVRPRFVTFLGDASYDSKNIRARAPAGQPGTLVPTYENRFDEGFGIDRQYATDDWILDINNNNLTTASELTPDFYSGRLPANDATGALQVVRDKILLYERTAPFGEYRNQVMLIADDDAQGEECDPLGWTHVQQTTQLDTTSTAAHMDRIYVYLHTYPSGAGATKPGARKDIKDHLNAGVAMFNYVGHGSPFKISDESVFIDSDAGTLTNGPRMPLFVAASCDVGKFNDPTVQSLGERLVMTPTGGCIGVVSATELALSGQNSALNLFMYNEIFRRDDVVVGPDTLKGLGQYHMPISGALLSAKVNAGTLSTNNSKYQLMGDAATRLNLPRLWADIAVTDANGLPVTQMLRGQTLQFRGRILDQPGGSALPFDGVANILIEDSAPTDNTGRNPEVSCFSHYYDVDYRYRAGTIYHGDVSVANGEFEGSFVVSLDAVAGAYGRVRAYVSGRAPGEAAVTDAVGSVKTQVSPGSAPAGDTQGPRINLSFLGGSTSVRPDAVLRIDLFDTNGIMTTGHSLQNSIVVTLDDNTTSRVDVTTTFRYAADSYQSGTARFTLPGLSPGRHKVRVAAADNLATGITASQHRSFAELEFDVVDTPPLRVARAFLFPTPTHTRGAGSGGVFVVDAPGDSVNTLVRIYTVSGKLIRVLKDMGGLGQVQIPWDGRDAEGEPLANGTYLFKVHVNVREADGTGSARQKGAAEGRFVIVNR
ncbi:MAG: C25 family cysteine peptidase, partial [Candidatus Eisenbacteria bacterium]